MEELITSRASLFSIWYFFNALLYFDSSMSQTFSPSTNPSCKMSFAFLLLVCKRNCMAGFRGWGLEYAAKSTPLLKLSDKTTNTVRERF